MDLQLDTGAIQCIYSFLEIDLMYSFTGNTGPIFYQVYRIIIMFLSFPVTPKLSYFVSNWAKM